MLTISSSKIFLPELVNRAQDSVALHFLERLGVLKADLDLVGFADLVGDVIADAKLRRAETVEDRVLDRRFVARLRRLAEARHKTRRSADFDS